MTACGASNEVLQAVFFCRTAGGELLANSYTEKDTISHIEQ
jgi:hypothetical protein